jgi:hypothetical protein
VSTTLEGSVLPFGPPPRRWICTMGSSTAAACWPPV